MKVYENGTYREANKAELIEAQKLKKEYETYERTRVLTQDEVFALFCKQLVNTLSIDDTTSLKMKDYYPTFEDSIGKTVSIGFKFTYKNDLYKTIQNNLTLQKHYLPGQGTESLYTRIDEMHTGTKDDPIPYNGNMVLDKNKYYIQNEVVYLCIRDSGTALYHPLNQLIGQYVQVVS